MQSEEKSPAEASRSGRKQSLCWTSYAMQRACGDKGYGWVVRHYERVNMHKMRIEKDSLRTPR